MDSPFAFYFSSFISSISILYPPFFITSSIPSPPRRKKIMDFMTPKAQPYFAVTDEKVMNTNNPESEHGEQPNNIVTSQLQIRSSPRSSPEALEKEAVLRRIRHHKCKNRVKRAFQALVGGDGQAQEKWMELGDAFTCP